MEKSFRLVQQLAADFKTMEHAYLSPSYQESQVRQDYIDRFFIALGWDVTHEHQKNPFAREVRIENNVKMESSHRRADYAFSIAPNFDLIKFFVEAKKPSRDLSNPDDYFQTIRYGWNAKTPIAILTDFEEFHILDCRYKPNIKTSMDRLIVRYMYTDYIDEEIFLKIYHLFGRDAVAAGSLEKFAAALPKKGIKTGGFQPVDDAFLEDLDHYREVLAKAFKKTNESLQGEELTEAVQRTIDRLVFIRFLEDKGIEEKQIISLHAQTSAWKAFLSLCKRLEPKYNGLVFKPHRILDSGEFDPPDDHSFADICQKLADPSSPYDFNQIPVSILGSIYERFLGKVVHATDKRVKVEEKPEVRKAGGVYYTPEYIVRYIVTETVGKLIEGKTPAEISRMAFADIACGSGSFLIEVYGQLCAYHLRYYAEHPEKAEKHDLFSRDGTPHLSLKKKKEILCNNVFGVDIDFQATEVTQLSLYLKMLEDATMNDAYQFGLFKETILPDLRQNIVCGNSLIGRDIVDGSLFADVDEAKLKPMNFEDAFPAIMKRGGFDAVVGNPPYILLQDEFRDDTALKYFHSTYSVASFKIDTYHLFVERGILQIKNEGRIGFIVPSNFLTNNYLVPLRKFILDNTEISEINAINGNVFGSVSVTSAVFVFKRTRSLDKQTILRTWQLDEDGYRVISSVTFPQQAFGRTSDLLFKYSKGEEVLLKIERNSDQLSKCATVNFGMQLRDRKKYPNDVVEVKNSLNEKRLTKKHKPCLTGKNIRRYEVNYSKLYCLEDVLAKKGGCWDLNVHHSKNKIIVRQIGEFPICGLDLNGFNCLNTVFMILPIAKGSSRFLLGILNSGTMNYYWRQRFFDEREAFPKIKGSYLLQLPIRTINFSDPSDKARHDDIVTLVNQMLESKQKLATAKTEAETNRLEMLCATIDRQIDEAVYKLYGLAEEEIKIVEGK